MSGTAVVTGANVLSIITTGAVTIGPRSTLSARRLNIDSNSVSIANLGTVIREHFNHLLLVLIQLYR